MSSATISKLMTAEEFYDWANRPENDNRWFELVRGEVIELPAPRVPHGVVTGNAVRILGNYTFKRRKGYVVSNDSGVILERDPDTVRGPDAAVYEGARSFDRITHKITDYLRNGVELVWVIDPKARTVTVYRPDKGPRAYTENDGTERPNRLDGVAAPNN